ncbi:hypothetical protein RND71_025189 [Anisodus tanguticus]|uniref:Uncharacterized protein n=1 Tax=Anisodus tanguticus TaxID=243964 RepID=A0AAE1RQY1_9SOLA|nr:hypothetical protein RND71_025189 [Anisodus tanguticus]
MPVWTMYCNGKKVGFAVKKKPTKSDIQVLKQMESVVVGAGTVHGKENNRDDDIMYLRGKFERVHGSSDSESFHLIDPEGSMGQQLSILFLRSRSSSSIIFFIMMMSEPACADMDDLELSSSFYLQ